MNRIKITNKKKSVLSFFFALIVLTSCETDFGFVNEEKLTTSDSFTFSTTGKFRLQVKVDDTFNGQYYYKVEVFDNNPASADVHANLLLAGVAKGNAPLQTEIVLAQHLSRIYVRQTDPLQRSTIRVISPDFSATEIDVDFAGMTGILTQKTPVYQKVIAPDPRATDYELPDSYTKLGSEEVTLSAKVYYLPAGISNAKINFGWLENSELYVAGKVTFNDSFYIPANCKLVILPGGSVTFGIDAFFEQAGVILAVHPDAQLIFNQAAGIGKGVTFVNDGTATLKGTFEIRQDSRAVNNGTINGKSFSMTNSSVFTNNFYINLTDIFSMNTNTFFNNNGVLFAASKIVTNNTTSVINNYNTLRTGFFDMINGGASLNNYCKIICNDFGVNVSTVNSYAGSVISCENLEANMTTFNLYGDAILKTGIFYEEAESVLSEGTVFVYNVDIKGISEDDNKPVVVINQLNKKDAWQALSVTGDMEFVLQASQTPDANYYKTIGEGVSFVESSTVTIEGTDCNDGGISADKGSHSPSGPSFPMEVTEENQYTFILEDLWPSLGDYDMNDLIFEVINIKKVINEKNEVLSFSFDINPLANGSTKDIAVALQFDKLSAGAIEMVSNGNIEEGQEKAGIILLEHAHQFFGNAEPVVTNTFNHVNKTEAKRISYTVTFMNPVAAADVIVSSLNFYTIVGEVDSKDRKEVHLAGFRPSSKVRTETNGYKDSKNMIWAMMLPVKGFLYPAEGVKIYDAYPGFGSWAASGGKTDTDWYLKPSEKEGLVYRR